MTTQISNIEADQLWEKYVTDHEPRPDDLRALLVCKSYFAPKAARLLLADSSESSSGLLNARLVLAYAEKDQEVATKAADILLSQSQLPEDLVSVMLKCDSRTDAAAQILLRQNPSQVILTEIVVHSDRFRTAAWQRINKTKLDAEDVEYLTDGLWHEDDNSQAILREILEMVLQEKKHASNLYDVLHQGQGRMAEKAAKLLLERENNLAVDMLSVMQVFPKYAQAAWKKMKECNPSGDEVVDLILSKGVEESIREDALVFLGTLARYMVDVTPLIRTGSDTVRQKAIQMALEFGCIEKELYAVCEFGDDDQRKAAATKLIAMDCPRATLIMIRKNVPALKDVVDRQLKRTKYTDEESLVKQIREATVNQVS